MPQPDTVEYLFQSIQQQPVVLQGRNYEVNWNYHQIWARLQVNMNKS